MDFVFETSLQNRRSLHYFLNNLSLQELNTVPAGFSNSIFWNIAHVVVTQQLLVYTLSGKESMLPQSFIDSFRKGTKHEKDATEQDVKQVSEWLFATLEKTKEDYAKSVFKNYGSYTTSLKVTLKTVEDGLNFNNFHEGIHLGYILAMKKAIVS
ncbi:DinB family protein [Sungkyunkwania multivorans]|uniref:DinB family protein n=1 Tax=Sungkyunkwania multivorans TaxID=1173618 RepID=A0ABW3D038_9FLAO